MCWYILALNLKLDFFEQIFNNVVTGFLNTWYRKGRRVWNLVSSILSYISIHTSTGHGYNICFKATSNFIQHLREIRGEAITNLKFAEFSSTLGYHFILGKYFCLHKINVLNWFLCTLNLLFFFCFCF